MRFRPPRVQVLHQGVSRQTPMFCPPENNGLLPTMTGRSCASVATPFAVLISRP
jgi:hypothetical protein